MFKLQLVVISSVLLLSGCSIDGKESHNKNNNVLSNIKGRADDFLKEKGYIVKSYEGMTKYTLKKEMLLSPSEMVFWGVQKERPDQYINKAITIETFIVKNHPLDKIYKNNENYLNQVRVMVIQYEGKVIGGTSFPVTNEELVGNPYSLDGKTLGEITSLDYQTWSDKWKTTYSK